MKIFFFLSFISFLVFSCKSVSHIQETKTDDIVKTAKSYQGTKYKYGGTTKRGMDCSGLVYTSFLQNNIKVPRTSYEQSRQGQSIPFNKLTKGDLLFFKNPSSKRIDHVGMVVSSQNKDLWFIHSSSSKGVITSSIKEPYWSKTFVIGKRIVLPASGKNTQRYTVKSGDTLYGIAKKNNTTVKAIKALNNLTSNEISIGMVLKIL